MGLTGWEMIMIQIPMFEGFEPFIYPAVGSNIDLGKILKIQSEWEPFSFLIKNKLII